MTAKRYWTRFISPGADARPVIVPAPCQWWCSGTTSDDDSVVCALVLSESGDPFAALEKWWPGLRADSASEVADDWKPGDRFPHKEPNANTWIEKVLP